MAFANNNLFSTIWRFNYIKPRIGCCPIYIYNFLIFIFNFLKKEYFLTNDIFCCNINDKSTQNVTNFYKETPFPNYKENDDRVSILEKGNKNILAYQFKKFIGLKKKVLEVGCGTGQLANFFSIGTNNQIVGLDPTIYSLNWQKIC